VTKFLEKSTHNLEIFNRTSALPENKPGGMNNQKNDVRGAQKYSIIHGFSTSIETTH